VSSVEQIVDSLRYRSRERQAVLNAAPGVWQRAGDIAPGYGNRYAQGFFRDSGLFRRRFRGGYLQYRLSGLGLKVRLALEADCAP